MALPAPQESAPRETPGRTATSTATWGGAIAGYLDGAGTVLIGRGVRPESAPVARILAGALQLHGIHVQDLGATAAPCLAYNTRAIEASLGLYVVGADPRPEQGLELVGPDGAELPEDGLQRLLTLLAGPPRPFSGTAGTYRADGDALDRYLRAVLSRIDADAVRSYPSTVVVDAGNGAAGSVALPLLSALGCTAFGLNAPGETDSLARGELGAGDLVPLGHAVVDRRADLGVAFDPTCGRVAFVDDRGRPFPPGAAIGLLAEDRLRERSDGRIAAQPLSATTLAAALPHRAGAILRLPPGRPSIGFGALPRTTVLFADDEGGIGWPDFLPAPDGILTMARMVALLARSDLPAASLLTELPASRPRIVAPAPRAPELERAPRVPRSAP
jgi:phosphomannomutase